MELVALLSTGKGSWNEVSRLIGAEDWEKIVLVGNEFAKKFTSNKKFDFIEVNLDAPVDELKKQIFEKIKSKLSGLEVSLSIASGNGIEHMVLISALLQIPVGVNFVLATEEGYIQL